LILSLLWRRRSFSSQRILYDVEHLVAHNRFVIPLHFRLLLGKEPLEDRRLLETTLRNTMKANKELKAEFRIRRGQEVRWVLIAGKSYENFGKPTVLGVMIDTTELKQQREAQGSQSV
jgi:PAS domain-containing protein